MHLTKLSQLTKAVVYIAQNSTPDAVRSKEICESLKLSQRGLEADLQKLAHAKILKSLRGPKGGYVLARERRNITIADIFDVIESDLKLPKFLKPALNAFCAEIKNIAIEDLCQEIGKSAQKQKVDFDI